MTFSRTAIWPRLTHRGAKAFSSEPSSRFFAPLRSKSHLEEQFIFNDLLPGSRRRLVDAEGSAIRLLDESGDEIVERHMVPAFLLCHFFIHRNHGKPQPLHLLQPLVLQGRIMTAVMAN